MFDFYIPFLKHFISVVLHTFTLFWFYLGFFQEPYSLINIGLKHIPIVPIEKSEHLARFWKLNKLNMHDSKTYQWYKRLHNITTYCVVKDRLWCDATNEVQIINWHFCFGSSNHSNIISYVIVLSQTSVAWQNLDAKRLFQYISPLQIEFTVLLW